MSHFFCHPRASLTPQGLLASPGAAACGIFSLEPYISADLKGILSTHNDRSVRVWDSDRRGDGSELLAFPAGPAGQPSRLLRAVTAGRRAVVSDAAPAESTHQEATADLAHTIVTGDGDGWVKVWTVSASIFVAAGTEDRVTAETLSSSSAQVSARTLVAAEGPETCPWESVCGLVATADDGSMGALVAAAIHKTRWSSVEEKEAGLAPIDPPFFTELHF